MARADMAEAVEHAEIGKDTAADHDVLEKSGIDAGNRRSWRLRAMFRQDMQAARSATAEPAGQTPGRAQA